MILYIVAIIVIILFVKIKKEHLHIDFSSFFKKGFKKEDDFYGIYCWDGKQRFTESHIL